MTLTMETLFLKLCAATLVATSAVVTTIHATELRVMSSGGFTVVYKMLGPRSTVWTGNSLNTALGPSTGKSPRVIPNRLARDEPTDAVIMASYTLDNLIKQGRVIPGSRVELVDSRIGIVVREGTAKPDISPPEALKHVLLYTKSIAYSDNASGVHIEHELSKKPGIEEQVKAKAKMTPCIPVASVVAASDYEVGFQQVSELLPMLGAIFVEKIPESLQPVTYYATGISVGAQHPKEAKAFLDYLASPAAQVGVKSTGFNSMPGQ